MVWPKRLFVYSLAVVFLAVVALTGLYVAEICGGSGCDNPECVDTGDYQP
jgi:hypothetical protein